ncbi:Glycerophosphoryl diester phosphodiesterase [Kibdelosporangium aridum]|uniref:Glycerophosphoryl diester phosphodiesterase n=1 Tax=Kibdelosporangium aridum TaxID=2030 RepID=A0A1Y5XYC2_KIBAR|nr:Glycerophosphoryl diester phosphodiesterase [Kibdelosporangium aridum]
MSRIWPKRAVAGLAATMVASMFAAPAQADQQQQRRGDFDLQAHRGGIGLRTESSLSSFGNAIRLGVSTLELDLQITEDGQAVVTHDRRVDGRKCVDTAPATPGDPEFPYVGKYVNTLTLAQVKTLDCGSKTLPDYPNAVPSPGSRMPLLREVFDLVKRYRADDVKLNIETKVEAGAPSETAPREQFVQVTTREIRQAGFGKRVSIQSFDWGALMRMRQVAPELPLVALTNYDFLQVGKPGKSPWLGGLDIDDFGGDPIAAVKSFKAGTFSPVHGFPQNGKISDPDYKPYVTKDMVRNAHRNGIKIVPWTVNDVPTMAKLIDDGVDGIITDYPDRLRDLMKQRGFKLPRAYASPFDIQAHRGGRSVRPENTLAAFEYSLGLPEVSTLELDTGVTEDNQLVVIHDRTVNGSHCVDTAPVKPGDPEFPYVGKQIRQLTLAQIKTIDCGSKTLPEFPKQVAAPGQRVPTLAEVFDLVKRSGRTDIRFNIETKISPTANDTAPYQQFTVQLVGAIEKAGMARRTTIQSFDWRTIRLSRAIDRRIETVALVWQYGPDECKTVADECSLMAAYGDPSVKSPWTGGLDWWQFRDLGKLVRAAGASTVSANWQVHDPKQTKVPSDDWYLRTDPKYYFGPDASVLERKYDLKVVPYTVNDEPTIQRVIDLGVTGIISDDPDVLIAVARRNGLR